MHQAVVNDIQYVLFQQNDDLQSWLIVKEEARCDQRESSQYENDRLNSFANSIGFYSYDCLSIPFEN